jgi:hypothetical protein
MRPAPEDADNQTLADLLRDIWITVKDRVSQAELFKIQIMIYSGFSANPHANFDNIQNSINKAYNLYRSYMMPWLESQLTERALKAMKDFEEMSARGDYLEFIFTKDEYQKAKSLEEKQGRTEKIVPRTGIRF